MTFNFNTPMTFYEFLALCLSVLALILPLIKTIYKTWIQQPKLKFLPAGRTYLYFNQSGSYIRIDGVYEANVKPVSVKNIAIKIRACAVVWRKPALSLPMKRRNYKIK